MTRAAEHKQRDLTFLRERALAVPLVVGLDQATGKYTVTHNDKPLITARREVVTAYIDGFVAAQEQRGGNMETTDVRGPWVLVQQDAETFLIKDRDGAVVATVLVEGDDGEEEARAKAALITQAPVLREIVQAVLDACNEVSPNSLPHTLYRQVQQRGAAALAEIDKVRPTRIVPAHPDFYVRDEGTMWVFTPNTPDVLKFAQTEMGLESWQWLGNAFAIEHRIAPDLKLRLESEGRSVEWEPEAPTATNAKRNAHKKPGRR